MSPVSTQISIEIRQFFQACLRAIVRAEREERLPARFSGTGQAVWKIFRNELTAADLVALAIQDTGVAMPIPFEPGQWWSAWPDWALLQPSPDDAEQWIDEALAQAEQSQETYLRAQASLLDVELPPDDIIANLPTPAAHEQWLELPGTAGWIAYSLATRPESNLYFWENFKILCATFQAMLLAGLIAWELGAPPRTGLPIQLDDPNLTLTLKSGQTYSAIVGRRDRHGHRDLRVLHQNGDQPIWI